jgi:hypothetical protein
MTYRHWSPTMRSFAAGVVLAIVVLTGVASAAGPDVKYKAPRNENGQLDFRGVWNFATNVPLQRPASFAGRKLMTPEEMDKRVKAIRGALNLIKVFAPIEAIGIDWIDDKVYAEDLRTSLITSPESGRLPKLVDGVTRLPGVDDIIELLADTKGTLPPELTTLIAAFQNPKRDSYEDFQVGERCLFGANAPLVPGGDGNYLTLIQSKDHIVLMTDATRRIVSLENRPHPSGKIRSWSGDSRGHWEGDTLVIETTNFNSRPASFAGAGKAYDKVVTERISRTSANTLAYEATVVDPKTFQDQVALSYPMTKIDARNYESACHEGNYSLRNSLSGLRAAEREAAAK